MIGRCADKVDMNTDALMKASKGLPVNVVARVINAHTNSNWHGFYGKRDLFECLTASDRHSVNYAELSAAFEREREHLAQTKVKASEAAARREAAVQERARQLTLAARDARTQASQIRLSCAMLEARETSNVVAIVLKAARERGAQLDEQADAYREKGSS